jgi:uncharacterized membrane protein YgaE (UPF0421/DUF939 family)
MSTASTRQATAHALLTAIASAMCLVLAEVWHLKHHDLAVWTTFLVMSQYSHTSFQKGVERVAGRGVGILAGLVLTTWFDGVPLVALGLIAVLLTACFYIYFSGRLAYTFLQAGLYLVAVFQIGHSDPTGVVSEAWALFGAVVLGVAVADIVNWLAGVEGDVSIELGTAPLFPIRAEWVNQSLMLAVTVLVTLVVAHAVDLPPSQSAISVLLLTISPHLQALIQKGELRIVGLALAIIWSVVTFLLIGALPFFPLLAVLLFAGQFVATYLTLTGGTYAYAGLQMGLVVPMVIVAEPGEFGTFTVAIQRFEGILLGLAASVIVAGLWPRFPLAEVQPLPPPPPSSTAMPGEMDV